MNRILLLVIAILLGIIIYLLLCRKSCTTTLPKSKCNIVTDYSNVTLEGELNDQQMKEMTKAYREDIGKSRINGTKDTDAVSIVFDLEKVKNLVWKIENSVCKSGCDTSVELGIRMYYIKYPKDVSAQLPGVPEKNRNKHAIAMVPVFKRNNSWFDFFFPRDGNGSSRCLFDDPSSAIGDTKYVLSVVGGGDGTNHGGVAPPPGTGSFPTLPDQQ